MPQASNPTPAHSGDRQGASSQQRVQSPRSGEPLLRNTTGYGGNSNAAPAGPMEGKFPLSSDEIFDMVERKDMNKLQAAGGVEGVVRKLATNPDSGLPAGDDHEARKMRYGENRLPEQEKVTLWKLIWEALKDKIMLMLIACAVLSIVFGMFLKDPETGKVERKTGWIEGCAILVSVVVVVLVSALSDYQKAKKFEELNKEQTKKPVQVIRAGAKKTIDATELLVGDVVVLVGGQSLAADCLCVQCNSLKIDESAATGESDTVKKGKNDPFLLSGTSVMEGEGRGVVIGVGVNSFAGKLTMQTRKPPSETPLQVKLGKMASKIGRFGLGGAVVTWVVLCGTYLLRVYTKHSEPLSVVVFLDNLIIAITIVVVAIPEGLPLAVTIALAYSMRSMLKDNCLVRVLKSCETMGGCTTICSDKTGTLTTNQMTVVQGWLGGESFLVERCGLDATEGVTTIPPTGEVKLQNVEVGLLSQLYRSIAINSTGEEVEDNSTHQRVWQGSKTEQGLLYFVNRTTDYKKLREEVPDRRAFPFSSERKRMTTVIRVENKCFVHVKGAAELILEECQAMLDAQGTPQPLDGNSKKEIAQAVDQMAEQGNRVIAVAFAESDSNEIPEDEPSLQWTLIGMLGMQDPIRKEVPNAVAACNRAGIIVRLVTGDNLHTATAIAKKCGIYKDGDTALEGREFRELAEQNTDEFESKLEKLRIIARSSPSDKFLLVTRLMERGDIVAVTGDGTNDAPALSTADVGFAMFAGTEIAKGASDMILMDNNFASVTNAVVWGRTVNDNIRKFLQFQLTTNVVGVLLTLIGSAVSSNNSSPLSPVQLLWLNLIMDTMAALALATEKPTRECLKRHPVSREAPLITRRMWSFIGVHSMYQLAVMLLLIYFGHNWIGTGPCTARDPPGVKMDGKNCRMGVEHKTLIFNTFILFQVVNEFNARKLYTELNAFGAVFSRSRMMLIIVALTVAFQFFAVHVAGSFMNTVPLTLFEWGVCAAIAVTEIPVGILQKLVARCIPEWKPDRNARRDIAHEDAEADEDDQRHTQGTTEERQALRSHEAEAAASPWQAQQQPPMSTLSARASTSWRNKQDFAVRAWEQDKMRSAGRARARSSANNLATESRSGH